MKILTIYDSKKEKTVLKNQIEIDESDLEKYKGFKHSLEFLELPSKIVNEKSIIEWFRVEQMSYWWFVHPIFAPKFSEIAIFIDRLEIFLEQNEIGSINLKGNFDKISIIRDICTQNNIKFSISQSHYFLFKIKKFFKNKTKKYSFKMITNKKYHRRNSCFDQKNQQIKPQKGCTIITSPGVYRKETLDPDTCTKIKEEFFIQPFLDILFERNFPVLCFDLDYTFRGSINTLNERLSSKYDWIPVDSFLVKPKSSKTNKIVNSLKKSISELLTNDLSNTFSYKNISILEYLKPTFDEIFMEPHLPSYIHLIEELEEFIEPIKPKSIIQVYETGPLAKAFEIVAKKLRINTIGLQHGRLQEDSSDYMIKEIFSKSSPLGNPIPDRTFVFGDNTKKLLTEKGAYPSDKVIVTGNPLLYNIEKIKKNLNKKKLLEKHNLLNKKIILVPLSYRYHYVKDNPDIRLLQTLFEGFKNNDDYVILVRPHASDEFNQSTLKKICPSQNFILRPGNTNFEDIVMSDIVVLWSSTFGIEAALFEKPVFYTGDIGEKTGDALYAFLQELVTNDVASFVPIDQIVKKIRNIQRDEEWKIEESKKKKSYMESFFNYGKHTDLFELMYHDVHEEKNNRL